MDRGAAPRRSGRAGVVAASDRDLLDGLPLVRLARHHLGVAPAAVGSCHVGDRRHPRLLRDPLGQPADRRSDRPQVPAHDRPRRRHRHPLPPDRGRSAAGHELRARTARGAGAGAQRCESVEVVVVVPLRRVVRSDRQAVRRRHRLLRLQAAVPFPGRRLAVRVPGGDRTDRGGGALPERSDPSAADGRTDHPQRQGPAVGAAGGDGAGEGRRLRPAALRIDLRTRDVVRRRRLHGGQRPDPGDRVPDPDLGVRRGAVHHQHLASGLGDAGHRRRSVGPGRARRRIGVPCVRAALPGHSVAAVQGAGVHLAQHHRDARCTRSGLGDRRRLQVRAGHHPRRHRSPAHELDRRPCARPGGHEGHDPGARVRARVLQVRRRRRRPLRRRHPSRNRCAASARSGHRVGP